MARRVKGGQRITPKTRPTAAGRKLAGKIGRGVLRGVGLVRNPFGPVIRRVGKPVAKAIGKGIGGAINRGRGAPKRKTPHR